MLADSPKAPAAWVSAVLGTYALVAGVLTLLGWALDRPRLTDWDGDGISMQANAAVAAACAGVALVLLATRRRVAQGLAVGLGLVCALIGLATLFEHASGLDLGIDTLLVDKPWGSGATVSRGRMGLPASIAFTLVGVGLLAAGGHSRERTRGVAPWLGVGAAGIGLLAIIGYIFGADALYTLPRLTGIALQTATVVCALGIGLAAAVSDRQPTRALLEDSGAGLLARRALPFTIGLPILLGFIRVRGQDAGLYDTGMGTALLVLFLIVLLCAALSWGMKAVSARERSLATAHRAEVRADFVLNAARDQFVVLDRAWRYTYVNDRVVEMTGLPRDKILGRTLWEVGPEIVGTPLDSAARRVLERQENATLEYYDPGRARWFDVRLYPAADGGIAMFLLEISERKRAEEALRETDRRKDEFLATLAHELRNPLAPIKNALEIMKRADGDPVLVHETRSMMERQIGQLVRLVDDLLDMGRITRNKLELRRERVELVSIMRQAVEAARPMAEEASLEVVVELPPAPIHLDADPVRLAQIFGNLLNNACRYAGGGRVTLTAVQRGSEAVVSVTDDGIGIPPDMLSQVFEPFTQVDGTARRSQGGLGIGLTLVKRLVELHDGTVTAHSPGPSAGSEFVVRLPILLEHAADGTLAQPVASPWKPRRILVVDDNHDAALSLATLLELTGHETLTAHDGDEALARAAIHRPDVILLDIGLPKRDGYDVCRAIRAASWGKEIVVIALTGWGQERDRLKSRAAGFNGHLVKPVDHAALMSLLVSEPTYQDPVSDESSRGA